MIKNIMFVNSAVLSLDTYINVETLVIGYDTEKTTTDITMMIATATATNNLVTRIGFAFHYSPTDPILFLNGEPFFTDFDLEESVEIYSQNVQFLMDLLLLGKITHVDFLACNTLQSEKWRQYYALLQLKTGVVVGASDNNTGNMKYGGDWVLESTQEEVAQIYFTSDIGNWAGLLFSSVLINSFGAAPGAAPGRSCFCIGGNYLYSMKSNGYIQRTDLRDNSVVADYYTGGYASLTLFYYNGFIYARNHNYDVCKIDVRGNLGVLINATFVLNGPGDPSLFVSDGTFLYISSSAVTTGIISRSYLGSDTSTTAPAGSPASGGPIPAAGATTFISNLNWGRQPCIVGDYLYVPVYGDNKIKKYQLSTGVLVDGDFTKGVQIQKLCGMVHYQSFFYVSQSYVYVGGQGVVIKSTLPHGILKIGMDGSVVDFFSELMTVGGVSWYADYTELAIYNNKLYCLEFNSTNIISIDIAMPYTNTYYHTFYTMNATTDPYTLKRTIYNNAGVLQETQDISYGDMKIVDVLSLMDGGGMNPYTIGIVDSSQNKISMDIAYCNVYTKPLTTIQQTKLMTYVNTTVLEPHTYMTAKYAVSVSGGVFVCKNSSNVVVSVPISLSGGSVYMFDQSDSTNSGRTFTLSSSLTSLTAITAGLTTNSTPGLLNAYTIVAPTADISASVNFFYVKVESNLLSASVFSFSTSLNGTYYKQPKLSFLAGNKYTFFVSDTSVTGYNLVFGTSVETRNAALYTTSGIAGQTGAYVLLDVSAGYSGGAVQYFEQTRTEMGYFVYSGPATPDKVWLKFERGDIVGTGVKDYVSNTYSGVTYYYSSVGGGGKVGKALTDISNITSSIYQIGDSALYLDYNQRIQFGSNGTQGSALTMSVWMKLKPSPDNIFGGPLFFYGPNDGWYGANSILIEMGATGDMASWLNNSQGSLAGTSSIHDGNWHHICLVIGSSFTKIYFDNTVARSESFSPINTNASYIYRYIFGANYHTATSFTGYVDDFRMYTTAFSATEVAGLYNYRYTEVSYTVTAVGSVLYLNGLANPVLTFTAGKTYIFYQSDTSNTNNQIVFSLSINGNPSISPTDGAVTTIVGTPGQSGAYTKLVPSVSFAAGTLYYIIYPT